MKYIHHVKIHKKWEGSIEKLPHINNQNNFFNNGQVNPIKVEGSNAGKNRKIKQKNMNMYGMLLKQSLERHA